MVEELKYHVTAHRGTRRWVLQCVEHPGAISETSRLREAPELMREMIAFVADVPADSIEIELQTLLPDGLSDKIAWVQARAREVDQEQQQVAAEARALVRQLKGAGLSGADVAAALGVSPQRVSQLSRS